MRSGSIALGAATAAMVLVLTPAAGVAQAHDGVRVTATPGTAPPGAGVDLRVTGCAGRAGTAVSPAFATEARLSGRGEGPPPKHDQDHGRDHGQGRDQDHGQGREDGRSWDQGREWGQDRGQGQWWDHAGGRGGDQGSGKGDGKGDDKGDGKAGELSGGVRLKQHLDEGTYPISVSCDGHDHRDAGTLRVRRSEQPPARPTSHPSPVAPVHAGGGGTAVFAAPAAPGVAQTASEEGLGTPYTVLGFGLAALAAAALALRGNSRRRTDSGAGGGAVAGEKPGGGAGQGAD
ncbi:hypothetical protein AB0C52_00820 [Streptomyces sp. NPDC048717]|uniref:hypothetical protein n=1 Tax=Streptomyces sp. NPDC048717 TaxID=3154928 RepID=UPI00343F5A5E